jgi:hypothetical protein
MALLKIKVVGVEGESILIKFATENSAKPIDEYDAVSYQPKTLGYATIEDFVAGIQPALLDQALHRDNLEKIADVEMDLSMWIGHESEHAYATLSDHNASLITNEAIANPEVAIAQLNALTGADGPTGT